MIVCDHFHSKLTSKAILLTSSRDSLDETERGIAKVNKVESTDSSPGAPALYISDKSGRTWLIPLAQCSIWLVSHIWGPDYHAMCTDRPGLCCPFLYIDQ